MNNLNPSRYKNNNFTRLLNFTDNYLPSVSDVNKATRYKVKDLVADNWMLPSAGAVLCNQK